MTLSDAAARHLAGVLENANASTDVSVRLAPGERGWVMRLDRPDPGDKSFEHDGRTVLVLAEAADRALHGTQLVVQETTDGAQLSLERAPGD